MFFMFQSMTDQEKFEIAVLKLMFADSSVCARMFGMLEAGFFENYGVKHGNFAYFSALSSFVENEGYFPGMGEFGNYIGDELKERHRVVEGWDIEAFCGSPWMTKNLEGWLRGRISLSCLGRLRMALKERRFGDIPALASEMAAGSVFSLGSGEGMNPISPEGADKVYDAIAVHKCRKVASGIGVLDALMDGGWSEKSLSGILLGTHQGKTMFLCTCAANAVRSGLKALYVSLEEADMSISTRIVRNLIERSKTDIRKMGIDEYRDLVGKAVKGNSGNLRVVELPESGTTPGMLLNKIKSLAARQKFVPDVIFVDYVGKMSPDGKRGNAPLHERLSEVTVQVRDISKTSLENHPPIVTAWQYNKEGTKNRTGDLTEMGSSYAQAHTADIVWAGFRLEGETEDDGVVSLKLAKARECAEDAQGTVVSLACRKSHQAMVDKEAEDCRQFGSSLPPASKPPAAASLSENSDYDIFG